MLGRLVRHGQALGEQHPPQGREDEHDDGVDGRRDRDLDLVQHLHRHVDRQGARCGGRSPSSRRSPASRGRRPHAARRTRRRGRSRRRASRPGRRRRSSRSTLSRWSTRIATTRIARNDAEPIRTGRSMRAANAADLARTSMPMSDRHQDDREDLDDLDELERDGVALVVVVDREVRDQRQGDDRDHRVDRGRARC